MSKKEQFGRQKAINPEERLQKSVAQDVKIRLMEDHIKNSADALSCAIWENKLHQKDDIAAMKRTEQRIASDAKLSKASNKQIRRAMLQELYKAEELMYEDELNMMGLSFRKERT
jgi:hypothetical protein